MHAAKISLIAAIAFSHATATQSSGGLQKNGTQTQDRLQLAAVATRCSNLCFEDNRPGWLLCMVPAVVHGKRLPISELLTCRMNVFGEMILAATLQARSMLSKPWPVLSYQRHTRYTQRTL